eukprot:EG_transcript_28363
MICWINPVPLWLRLVMPAPHLPRCPPPTTQPCSVCLGILPLASEDARAPPVCCCIHHLATKPANRTLMVAVHHSPQNGGFKKAFAQTHTGHRHRRCERCVRSCFLYPIAFSLSVSFVGL